MSQKKKIVLACFKHISDKYQNNLRNTQIYKRNISGICRHILGISQKYARHILGIFLAYLKHISGKCQAYLIQTIRQISNESQAYWFLDTFLTLSWHSQDLLKLLWHFQILISIASKSCNFMLVFSLTQFFGNFKQEDIMVQDICKNSLSKSN